MRVRICTLHEDDFFQCRVIAMVVLALILNELFLLASHLLPVDPVYLFRHRITRNGRNRTCSVVIPPFLLSRPLPSRSQRLPCSKVSYYPRPPLREDPQFPTFRRRPSFRAATVYLCVLCRATLHCHYVALPLVTEMGGNRMC